MASAPTPGLIIGYATDTNVFHSFAPSILAASIISVGIPSANCLIRKIPNGHPTIGKITAQMVLYSFSADISRNNGIKITCFGSAMAHTIKVNTTERPMKRFFASAYPAIAAVKQVRNMDTTAINTVFISQRTAAGTTGPANTFLVNGIASSHNGAVCLLNSFS